MPSSLFVAIHVKQLVDVYFDFFAVHAVHLLLKQKENGDEDGVRFGAVSLMNYLSNASSRNMCRSPRRSEEEQASSNARQSCPHLNICPGKKIVDI